MAKIKPPSPHDREARDRASRLLDAAAAARAANPAGPLEGRLAIDLRRYREVVAELVARRLARERGETRLALIHLIGTLGESAFAAPLLAFVQETGGEPTAKRAALDAARALGAPVAAALAEQLDEAARLAAVAPAELAGEGGEAWVDRVAALPPRLAADAAEAFFARFPGALPEPLPPLERLRGRHDALDLVVIDALAKRPEPRVGLFLAAWLGDLRPGGPVEKALRRALYVLRTRGIAVPEAPHEEEAPLFRPVREEAGEQGWASALDGAGDRIVWLAGPRRGALYLFQAVVNEERGLLHFSAGETSRRSLREGAREAEAARSFPLVPVEPAYALALIEAAAARQLAPEAAGAPAAQLAPLPPAYKAARPLLMADERARGAVAAEPPAAPILARRGLDGGMDTAELEARLGHSAELHRLDEFAGWRLADEAIGPLIEELDDAARSPLVVGEEQRRERFQQIFDGFIDRVFDEAARDRWRRRLEAQADYLDRAGRENDWKTALAAARGLSPLGPKPARHPFVIALVQKHVAMVAAEARRRAAEEPRLVVPPGPPRRA